MGNVVLVETSTRSRRPFDGCAEHLLGGAVRIHVAPIASVRNVADTVLQGAAAADVVVVHVDDIARANGGLTAGRSPNS
jgi:hypothetical protein